MVSWGSVNIGLKEVRTNNKQQLNDEIDIKRRIFGDELILPFVYKYKKQLGKMVLETSISKKRLLLAKNFPQKILYHIQYNKKIRIWFERYSKEENFLHNLDNKFGFGIQKVLRDVYNKIFLIDDTNLGMIFDSIIITNILNYTNHEKFFSCIFDILKKEGLIFVNVVLINDRNSIHDKIQVLPNILISNTIERCGFRVIEKEMIETKFNNGKNRKSRLILVAKKI